MKKQVLVIGLGQFGLALSRALSERQVEVLAVDRDPDLVSQAAEYTDEALCFDATDEAALVRTAPERRDLCVCAIGNESRESSIICTALLRQMGARRIIARSNDVLHERILRLIGAHEIVNPERDFGQRLANLVANEGVLGELPLGSELVLTELRTPAALVGQSLFDLGLPKKYGVTVAAIRRAREDSVILPDPKAPLEAGDILVVVSREGAIGKLLKKV